MTPSATPPPHNVDAIIQDGPHAGYTYPWAEGRQCLIVEGIKLIHTYRAEGVDPDGRVILRHQHSQPRPRATAPIPEKVTPC